MDADERKELEERISQRVTEQILVSLPNIIHHLIGTAAAMRIMSDKFYKDNPDLVEHKLMVAKAIETVQAKNPGMKVDKLMQEALPLIRSRIKDMKRVPTGTMSRSKIDQELGNL